MMTRVRFIGLTRFSSAADFRKGNGVRLRMAVHPQVVVIGARRLRHFTVALIRTRVEFQPRRLVDVEAA